MGQPAALTLGFGTFGLPVLLPQDTFTVMISSRKWTVGRAFTLIELLVVIGIIAVLASLLLSALHSAKMSGEGAVCRSNERQMGIALRLYVEDTGFYPYDWEAPNVWSFELEAYAGDKWPSNNLVGKGVYALCRGVFTFPGFDRLPGVYARDGSAYGFSSPMGAFNYNGQGAYNPSEGDLNFNKGIAMATPQTGNVGPWRPVKESEVLNPSDMIAINDNMFAKASDTLPPDVVKLLGPGYWGCFDCTWDVTDPFPGTKDNRPYIAMQTAGRRRHNGRLNVLFCDGHTETSDPQRLYSNRDELARRWNKDNEPHNQR